VISTDFKVKMRLQIAARCGAVFILLWLSALIIGCGGDDHSETNAQISISQKLREIYQRRLPDPKSPNSITLDRELVRAELGETELVWPEDNSKLAAEGILLRAYHNKVMIDLMTTGDVLITRSDRLSDRELNHR